MAALQSHPRFPFYLSGGYNGEVCLWEFGVHRMKAVFNNPTKDGRICNVRFNAHGNTFGSAEYNGILKLWRFAADNAAMKPFYSIQSHQKRASDLIFLNSGSVIAAAGIDTNGTDGCNLCIIDSLLPPHKAKVAGAHCNPGGAHVLMYLDQYQLLVSGGVQGDITVYDIRQRVIMHTFEGEHSDGIRALSAHPNQKVFVSGSTDGNMKVILKYFN